MSWNDFRIGLEHLKLRKLKKYYLYSSKDEKGRIK